MKKKKKTKKKISIRDVAFVPVMHPRAKRIIFQGKMVHVYLYDGRQLLIPLKKMPELRNATPEQRANLELIARGAVAHWPDLDEYIGIRRMMVPDGEPY